MMTADRIPAVPCLQHARGQKLVKRRGRAEGIERAVDALGTGLPPLLANFIGIEFSGVNNNLHYPSVALYTTI